MATMETDRQQLQSESVREKIARRAYEVYESRGGQDGHDLEDWLTAESEVHAEIERPTVKSVSAQTPDSEQSLSPTTAKPGSARRSAAQRSA